MEGQAQRVHDFKQFYKHLYGNGPINFAYKRTGDVVCFREPKIDFAWCCYEMGAMEALNDVLRNRAVSEYVRSNYENSE